MDRVRQLRETARVIAHASIAERGIEAPIPMVKVEARTWSALSVRDRQQSSGA